PKRSTASFIVVWVLFAQLMGNSFKRAFSLGRRSARLEAAYNEEVVAVAGFEPIATRLDLVRHHHGNKQLGRVGHFRSAKTFGSYTDNRERVAIECESLAHHAAIRSKTFLPVAMADYRDRM